MKWYKEDPTEYWICVECKQQFSPMANCRRVYSFTGVKATMCMKCYLNKVDDVNQ